MSGSSFADYFTVTEYGLVNARPIFIFGGWLTRHFYYSGLMKCLIRHGFKCVLYIPRRKLVAIGTDYNHVVAAGRWAVKDVHQRLAAYDGDKAVALGVSLGTTFAMEVVKQSEQIKRAVLLAPAGDFEKHVKRWQKQPYFKRIIAAQPTTPDESGKLLNTIGALRNIDLLRDKELLIGYVANDRVMHIEVAKELIVRLRDAGVALTTLEVKGGHNTGLLRYAFNKAYITFLIKSD